MIENAGVAKQISDLMLECSQQIDRSIEAVQDKCGLEEFKAYRLAAAKVLAEIHLEVLKPLYLKHPELKPPQAR